MDALLFAAGLGTRLRPLTDVVPKALIGVGGVAMLERVARRAIEAGADRLIVNVHHHALQIEGFVRERDGFGVEVLFSREPERPLETGGGLAAAAHLLRGDGAVLLHNTDVLTDFSLPRMLEAHADARSLATLAVNRRSASRYLLFDDRGLCGHEDTRTDARTLAREPEGEVRRRAFCGVHVVEPDLPDRFTEQGAFSIVEPYLRLAGAGQRIAPFDIGDAMWIDVGTPERLAAAGRLLADAAER